MLLVLQPLKRAVALFCSVVLLFTMYGRLELVFDNLFFVIVLVQDLFLGGTIW